MSKWSVSKKWLRTQCKNYRSISLLSMVGKIYVVMLVDRVCRMTGGLIDDDQGPSEQGGVV